MRVNQVRPEFVEFIPDHLADGVLYISERFRTCSHKCCCGCGEEVVTPLSEAEWRLTREGKLVSLWPSVGNWNYACRSHYFIRRNTVRWAAAMTVKQIAKVQHRDAADLGKMVSSNNAAKDHKKMSQHASPPPPSGPIRVPVSAAKKGAIKKPMGLMARLMRRLFGH
jgi:hypothetical protein